MNPVISKEGTIPSEQLNYSKFEYLNIPGTEHNVNNFTEQILFQEKKRFGHYRIINLFPSCLEHLNESKTKKKTFNRTSSDPTCKKKKKIFMLDLKMLC